MFRPLLVDGVVRLVVGSLSGDEPAQVSERCLAVVQVEMLEEGGRFLGRICREKTVVELANADNVLACRLDTLLAVDRVPTSHAKGAEKSRCHHD